MGKIEELTKLKRTYKPYRCHQCNYFRESELADTIQGLHNCVRYPPNSNNEYAKVMTYDWCGEGICDDEPDIFE